ncbi:DUF982 domain-containing protein [Roseibium salinum]|uniref:DUF982 domain-containing protein n=1 Tax=Roseibium salinum TaxID=1604349 RepID=A0ABT3QX99_9HYPH|nr:DUF982 domain-containing protein [Roseibium sp. DSM 29163]MCX2721564.1 DUF982 domain-containing protein [Roseibium sp. DSM 29163]MDN3722034.1 DUF982 domain-containing protein [Roseibium salinum]
MSAMSFAAREHKERDIVMYRFKQPVPVLVGIGFPTRINSVNEAYALLEDWPCAQRDKSYEAARNACRACISGNADAESVYGAFCAFAERHELLIAEAQSAPSALDGGVETAPVTGSLQASLRSGRAAGSTR